MNVRLPYRNFSTLYCILLVKIDYLLIHDHTIQLLCYAYVDRKTLIMLSAFHHF